MDKSGVENGESLGQEERLFRAALTIPAGPGREAYLDAVAGGDGALRERLGALIAAHEEPAAILGTNAQVTISEPLPKGELGITIDRYKILEKIGEGGCGMVYVAEQTEPVRRRVALKVIKLGMDTKAVVARFEAERQALAMMDHPNIARVLDAGTTDEGRPYFVMELVRGIKVTEYCDQNQLSTKERLDLFTRVCNAIQHAHQKGIIHRDIKPSNILVTLHDGVPVPKVIDFGIAKATEGRLTEATVYTQLHQFIGTPAYMSPEQAEMSGLDVDTRSDIYSLGVLLYELLTGSTPFDAKELLEAGIDEMRRTIREHDPVRPSTRLATLQGEELTTTAKRRNVETGQLMNQLKGDLDWIVMKCLEKDRTRRYETANGLAADIKRHLNYEPVTARPPSVGYRCQKAFRRNKLAFTAAGAVAITLVVGVVVSSSQAFRANRASRVALAAQQEAEESRGKEAEQRLAAEEAAEKARANEAETRLLAYVSDSRVAQIALGEGHRNYARTLMSRYIPKAGETDLRGVEWRYLWDASNSDELATFKHPAIVPKAVVSRDGRWLATSCFDQKVRVWDLKRGTLQWEKFCRYSNPQSVSTIAVSPFSDLVVATGSDGMTQFRIESGEEVDHSPGRYGSVYEAEGVPELFIGGKGEWKFASLADGRWVERRWSELASIKNLQYHSWASAGRLGEWVVITPQGLGKVKEGTGTDYLPLMVNVPVAVAASKLGRWAVVGGENGEVQVYRLTEAFTNSIYSKVIKAHPNWVLGLAFSPDEKLLATGGNDQLIHLWELPDEGAEPRRVRTLQGHNNEIWWLTFDAAGQKLYSAGKDATARVWSLQDADQRQVSVVLPPNSIAGEWEPNSRSFWTASGSGAISSWDASSGTKLSEWMLPPGWQRPFAMGVYAWPVACGPRGIAFADTNGVARVADARSGKILSSFAVGDEASIVAAGSPDGRWLITHPSRSQETQELTCWEVSTGTKAFSWNGSGGIPGAAWAFSGNGEWLSVSGPAFQVIIFDLKTKAQVAKLPPAGWFVSAAAFSPDSTLIAVGSQDASLRIFSTSDWKLVREIQGHLSGIHRLGFSRDGKTLMASDDNLVTRFWHVATGRELLRFDGAARLNGNQLSPDESMMLTQPSRTGDSLTLRRFAGPLTEVKE